MAGGSTDPLLAASAVQVVDSKADLRRIKILDHAATLFEETGFHNTSMNAIAAAAGIRKPTLYHYFDSKAAILFGVHEGLINVMIEQQARRLNSNLAPTDAIYEFIADIIGLMRTHRGYVKAFIENVRELPPDMRRDISRKRAQYQSMLNDVLSAGMASGEFETGDPQLTSHAIFGMVNWAYQWYGEKSELSVREVATHFHRLVVHGLAT
jgi:AcrR family transcriptional regulator